MAVLENDDDGVVRAAEDMFRRATFHWAQSTKRLVETANALGKNTRVAHAALVDIEHARTMLNDLFVPSVTKSPANMSDDDKLVTAEAVQESVSGVVARIISMPSQASQLQHTVDEIVGAPPIVRTPPVKSEDQAWADFFRITPAPHRGANLSAPVYSKNGKMRWADADCPACPSKAHERCRRPDGAFMEKPHKARTEVWLK